MVKENNPAKQILYKIKKSKKFITEIFLKYKKIFCSKCKIKSYYPFTLSVDGMYYTNTKDIVESFNNYLISLSQELEKKISPIQKKSGSYLFKLSIIFHCPKNISGS